MPFQIIRDNINSVLCDAVVDTFVDYHKFRVFRIRGYKLTKPSNGSLRHVIHIPIPSKRKTSSGPKIIRHCYRRALRIVSAHHFRSVAFPLIGSECDDLPKEVVLEIASFEIKRFLADHEDTNIILVISNDDAFQPASALLSGLSEYLRFIEVRERQKTEQQIMLDMVSTGALPIITPKDIQEEKRKTQPTYLVPQAPAPSASQKSPNKGYSWPRERQDQKNAVETAAQPGSVSPFEAFLHGQGAILDESFSQMVLRKIDEKGFSKDSDCYCKANIDRRLFSRIRCDENYHPKKTTAVALAIALELTLEETNELLRKAGYSLSHSIIFDVIIEYCILQHNYNVFEINELLFMYNQPLLGG